MSQFDLNEICTHFFLQREVKDIKPMGEGFINDTFIVIMKSDDKYLLQRKNKNIFVNVPGMMENINKVTSHIRKKIIANDGDPKRETLTITPTTSGKLYHIDNHGEYWTVCEFIKDSVTCEKVDSLEIAYAGGKGVGRFQSQLVDFNEPLIDILPGFHDIRFRFQQWDNVISKDPAGKNAYMKKEIGWIEDRRNEMMNFWKLVEAGIIPKRVVHNDTKISNILFDKNGEVLCMIDLDTVMNNTVLTDFGDAMRSYTNTGLEDEKDLSKVNFDIKRFDAFAKGYLEETREFLTKEELEYLPFAARYITFEQVLRFLMDYLDGNKYYRIHYPEHNLVRANAQFKLLIDMEAKFADMKASIELVQGSRFGKKL